MSIKRTLLVATLTALSFGQRPPFAGKRPIGFPDLANATTTADGLGNRFGEGDGTTQRLPIEALGDRGLIDRLSKLPVDKQPFWFINWQALEQHRQNPQTYPQRPSPFADTILNSNSTSNIGNGNLNSQNVKFNSAINSDSAVENKNGGIIPNSKSGGKESNLESQQILGNKENNDKNTRLSADRV